MKNMLQPRTSKLKRPVKKWDIHGCVFCPACRNETRLLRVCEMKGNKMLDFLAIKKNVIPEWCPLPDYD